ncbi:protein Teyrha-meyrha isoform X2 [Topomyia yanbarensis]|uniref:protein Teyrha-meyrha isoform X2 n=1 Tax=Topomyia yanbarensis TaxID=2498891 RepID=UPI00273CDE8D|nr:protein Teyrha-meyrha isoform X2 [Topomyia yanbarensis]
MDNPSYGTSHMSSPALVVFSQAANGLSDALRIQRPFQTQLPDAKDLHHLSLMSGYGAHLLHGFQPHFLHPLNPAVSTASGTSPFGGGGAFVKPFPSNLPLPSAFTPPKCLGFGIDQGLLFGGSSGSESFRTSDSSSPACTSLSPPAKDESMEGHTSEEGDRDRICSPERSPETPGFRLAAYRFYQCFTKQGIGPPKKSFVGTPPPNSCPICGIQLAPSDLETHFSAELTRLSKMSSAAERLELRRTLGVDMHAMQSTLQGRTSRWETFKNIRNKRQDRLRGKLRKRKFDGEDGFGMQLGNVNCQSCPVCHGRLQRTQEEIAQHIEDCVRKQHHHQQQQQQQQQSSQSSTQDEDETVDVESYGDETSNGAINMTSNVIHHTNGSLHNNNNNNNNVPLKPDPMTKIPPMEESAITSLSSIVPHWDRKTTRLNLPLNCTATSDNSITRVTPTSSDQRIDVDYEQDHDHSQDMVTDNDEEVIVDNTDDEDCLKRHRSTLTALGGHLGNGGPNNSILRDEKNSTEEATSSVEIDSVTDSMSIRTAGNTPNSDSYVSTSEPAEPSSKAQVLEELKARIRELEGSPHYKCFICKEKCKTLIISKICGHYLCEECWITESDSSKICPRCRIVTANSDFRKIHA